MTENPTPFPPLDDDLKAFALGLPGSARHAVKAMKWAGMEVPAAPAHGLSDEQMERIAARRRARQQERGW
jgi:hypothetical protein